MFKDDVSHFIYLFIYLFPYYSSISSVIFIKVPFSVGSANHFHILVIRQELRKKFEKIESILNLNATKY